MTILAIIAAMLVLLGAWVASFRQRSSRSSQAPPGLLAVGNAGLEPGDRLASPAAEQIEEMVKSELNKHPDLADVRLVLARSPEAALQSG